jgi:hypothetical protein
MKQELHNNHDTSLNNGETWIQPTFHLAANRQQSDDPSGVESSHPEHSGRLQVSPTGRVFNNHENAALLCVCLVHLDSRVYSVGPIKQKHETTR